jgi:hypothetical protein
MAYIGKDIYSREGVLPHVDNAIISIANKILVFSYVRLYGGAYIPYMEN